MGCLCCYFSLPHFQIVPHKQHHLDLSYFTESGAYGSSFLTGACPANCEAKEEGEESGSEEQEKVLHLLK